MEKKIVKVKDEHRQNELSLQPGGTTVKLVYLNETEILYDKVKAPEHYIDRILCDPEKVKEIKEIWIGESIYWKNERNSRTL